MALVVAMGIVRSGFLGEFLGEDMHGTCDQLNSEKGGFKDGTWVSGLSSCADGGHFSC